MAERSPKKISAEMRGPQLESMPATDDTIKSLRDTVAAKLRKNSIGFIYTREGLYFCSKSSEISNDTETSSSRTFIMEFGEEAEMSYTLIQKDEDYLITKEQAGSAERPLVSEGELQRLNNRLSRGRFLLQPKQVWPGNNQ